MPDKKVDYPLPMKGLTYDPDKSKLPPEVIVMPKLNGVRMRWDVESQCLRTNNGIKVKSCDHIVEQIIAAGMDDMPLDGESYYHGPEHTFSDINGKTRRKVSSKETEFLEYHLFDLAEYDRRLSKRFRVGNLKTYELHLTQFPNLRIVPSRVARPVDIYTIFKDFLEDGYEGIMISDPFSYYQSGRSKCMWKHKPVYDAEFPFMGIEYATEGRNKVLGLFSSIILGMPDGSTFRCSGISDKDKRTLLASPPPIGTPITIEYGDLSDTGTPLFPRFKGIRWDQ